MGLGHYSKLGRPPLKRLRLLQNLTTYLFEYEFVETTKTRAKAVQVFAEKVINMAKKSSIESPNPELFENVRTDAALYKLMNVLVPRYNDRTGGCIRIWNAGRRRTDKAPMSVLELMDQPLNLMQYFKIKKDIVLDSENKDMSNVNL